MDRFLLKFRKIILFFIIVNITNNSIAKTKGYSISYMVKNTTVMGVLEIEKVRKINRKNLEFCGYEYKYSGNNESTGYFLSREKLELDTEYFVFLKDTNALVQDEFFVESEESCLNNINNYNNYLLGQNIFKTIKHNEVDYVEVDKLLIDDLGILDRNRVNKCSECDFELIFSTEKIELSCFQLFVDKLLKFEN